MIILILKRRSICTIKKKRFDLEECHLPTDEELGLKPIPTLEELGIKPVCIDNLGDLGDPIAGIRTRKNIRPK
jgi:hypothetical protein